MTTTQTFAQTKSELVGRVRHAIDEAPHSLSSANDKLEQFAREQPLVTAVIALATGFFIARTLARHF
jgi:hypothetical protein